MYFFHNGHPYFFLIANICPRNSVFFCVFIYLIIDDFNFFINQVGSYPLCPEGVHRLFQIFLHFSHLSFNPFGIYCLYDVEKESSFIFFQMDRQLCLYHLLNNPSFYRWVKMPSWPFITFLHTRWSATLFSPTFWSICVFWG